MLIVLSCFSWKAIDVLPDRKYTKLALHDFYDIFSHFHFMLDMTLINSPIYHNLFRIGLTFQATPAWRRSSEGVIFQTITISSIEREKKGSTQGTLNPEAVGGWDLWPRCVFLHVALPGQQPGAEDFPADYVYPTMAQVFESNSSLTLFSSNMTHWYQLTLFYLTMTQIGLGLVTVLDHFKVKMWVFWEFDQQEIDLDFGSQLYS